LSGPGDSSAHRSADCLPASRYRFTPELAFLGYVFHLAWRSALDRGEKNKKVDYRLCCPANVAIYQGTAPAMPEPLPAVKSEWRDQLSLSPANMQLHSQKTTPEGHRAGGNRTQPIGRELGPFLDAAPSTEGFCRSLSVWNESDNGPIGTDCRCNRGAGSRLHHQSCACPGPAKCMPQVTGSVPAQLLYHPHLTSKLSPTGRHKLPQPSLDAEPRCWSMHSRSWPGSTQVSWKHPEPSYGQI